MRGVSEALEQSVGDGLSGRVLAGRYRLLEPLGTGGIGCVYRAEHLGLGKKVAVKLLLDENVGQASLRLRFNREAEILASLSHPNIVAISDFGFDQGTPFLVMELLEGTDLARLLHRTPLSPSRGVAVFRQILRGLSYAHEHGLVHRDLKPQNIFVRQLSDGTDHVTVLDFGLARYVGGEDRALLTSSGAVIGTPAYMAPEQVSGEMVDARADVYAAAILLFEILSRRRPFAAKSAAQLLRAHLVEPPSALTEVDRTLSIAPGLARFFEVALDKTPQNRFANAGDMLRALDTLGPDPVKRDPAALSQPQLGQPLLGQPQLSQPQLSQPQLGHAPAHAAAALTSGRRLTTQADPRSVAERGAETPAHAPTEIANEMPQGRAHSFINLSRHQAPRRVANEGPVLLPEEATVADRPAAGRTRGEAGQRTSNRFALTPFRAAMGGLAAALLVAFIGLRAARPAASAASAAAPAEPPPSSPPAETPAAQPLRGPLPEPLRGFRARIEAGHVYRLSALAPLRRYAREHPSDARAPLLIAHAYTDRRSLTAAYAAYMAAYRLDPNVRHDHTMLLNLLEMVRSRSLSRRATQFILQAYGKGALPSVEAELAGPVRYRERPRLERLRDALRLL